jgi:hypothetical protein
MQWIKTERKGTAQIISLIVLLTVIFWTIYYLSVSPDQVYIRLQLKEEDLGSKWRITFMPFIMTLCYFVLLTAEKAGMVNTPYKEPVSREEAGRIAANINVLSMFIFLIVIVGMVSGKSMSLSDVGAGILTTAFIITVIVIVVNKFGTR